MPKTIDETSQLTCQRPDSELIRILEVFSVTEAVKSLFISKNIRCGDVLQHNQIRQFVLDYIKEKVVF